MSLISIDLLRTHSMRFWAATGLFIGVCTTVAPMTSVEAVPVTIDDVTWNISQSTTTFNQGASIPSTVTSQPWYGSQETALLFANTINYSGPETLAFIYSVSEESFFDSNLQETLYSLKIDLVKLVAPSWETPEVDEANIEFSPSGELDFDHAIATLVPVPEPTTATLLTVGLAAMHGLRRRRAR